MRLYLIRHAQSANNIIYDGTDNALGRVADPEITELGIQQSKALARYLSKPGTEPGQHPFDPKTKPNFGISHLYCSFMTRTILTANYLSNEINIPLHVMSSIFEHKGLYEVTRERKMKGVPGPGRSYFEHRFPNLVLPHSLDESGWWNGSIETDEAFRLRVKSAFAYLIAEHGNTNHVVALVTHWGFMDQFVNEVLGIDPRPENHRSPWRADWVFDNTSVSRFDFINGSKNIIYLNRTDHLGLELKSRVVR
ncbi:MAG: hypothetical protein GKR95_05995 [Gammaproteobacteria bacterium]|nr:hypothetical protein [Gammaproteobacteria bacterium]